MNEYLRRRSDKLVYSLAGLRLEEAMVDMEIGCRTDIDAGLVLDKVCLKTQKTREEPCNKIGYNVGKDDRMIVDNDIEIGNRTDIQASLVLEEVCPEKQKTGEELGNKIGYNVGKDDHKVGDSDEVELEARLVPDKVGPEKLKTREVCVIRLALRTTTWT